MSGLRGAISIVKGALSGSRMMKCGHDERAQRMWRGAVLLVSLPMMPRRTVGGEHFPPPPENGPPTLRVLQNLVYSILFHPHQV